MSMLKKFSILLILTSLFVVTVLIVTPPWLITAVTPAKPPTFLQPPAKLEQKGNISIGRRDVLFHVSSQERGRLSVQQFVHFYFSEQTAVANYNANKNGNPERLPGNSEQYLVELPPLEAGSHNLLCVEAEAPALFCEYRAQMGRWTIHTDWVSRDTTVYSQEDFMRFLVNGR